MNKTVIPVRKHRAMPGSFTWPSQPTLSSPRDTDTVPLVQLTDDLKRHAGVRARRVLSAAGEGDLVIRRDVSIKPDEGYRLVIAKDGITLAARTDAGTYYGIQTLREWVAAHGATLPCGRLDDEPDMVRRGVYYDVARGKVPTVDTLKALVECLAHWKINEFQIYIKNTFAWSRHPDIGKRFSPYSPEDILAVQAHCRLHHVRFVPSLATLSHNELTLQLPAYAHLAELPGSHGWEGGTMFCPTDPKSFQLVEDLYDEFLPLFEAKDMNICCDEPWELGKGRSKRTADRIGAGQVYLNFLLKVYRLCGRYGKRMNVWGDIVLKYPELIAQLPKDVVMLNWDYAANGLRMPRTREFTEANVPVVVCPGTSSWQRHGTDMPNAMANVAAFARIGRSQGAEGLLNTDWGDFGHRNPLGVSLHGFAHGAAHAWHGSGVDDATFTATFAAQMFGDKAFAAPLRTLGEAAGMSSANSTCLYHSLVEPILPPVNRFINRFKLVSLVSHSPEFFPNAIDRGDLEGLQKVIEQLGVKNFWPATPDSLPAFEQQALADCHLATTMDILAAQRCLMAQMARADAKVPAGDWTAWADAMVAMQEGFVGLWRLRFRPSRLADNLKLMRWAEEEARSLAQN